MEGRSACGLPLRDGVRIVIMDLNTYPDYQAHRAIAASRGYRGVSIDAPLDRNIGKSVGMLSTLFSGAKPCQQASCS